jgi:AraC-like DNA-binding protein
MSQQGEGLGIFRLSTRALPERDRVEAWRETIGRAIMNFEIDPTGSAEFEADMTLQALPGLGISEGSHSGMRYRRSAAELDSDDLVLGIVHSGEHTIQQLDRELAVSTGQVYLATNAEPCMALVSASERFLALRVPLRTLAPMLTNLDGILARSIVPQPQALRLFLHYKSAISALPANTPSDVSRCIAQHVCDLVALMLGATRDATEIAKAGGVRAARLHTIKADIEANVASRELSVSAVSTRHGVTPRYVQILFETEGTTFTEFVLAKRLDHALNRLADPLCRDLKISEIAYAVGFSDLSYFNRAFRRRYGDTPSGVRGAGKWKEEE